jgi:UDP-N-acetylmuramoylalanine--D-glutamate ligase
MALVRYLAAQGANVVASDIKPAEAMKQASQGLGKVPVRLVFGGHPPELLDGADLLCLSGGVPADLPLAQQARERSIPLSNDSQVFLEACPAPTIGITGSAGKTTTTALVGRMADLALQGTGRKAWVGGNIGRPLLEELEVIAPDDLVVLELSSFQLELMTASPSVAAVLNLTPNHLDRHKTMQAYTEAKSQILIHQRPGAVAVLGRDDPGAWALRKLVRGGLVTFGWEKPADGDGTFVAGGAIRLRHNGQERPLCALSAIRLRGDHNVLNVAAACAIAAAARLKLDALEEAIRTFEAVPHRLEFVRAVRGADWYNDSIATAPERTLAAIRAFGEPLILLAGGRDKDLPWADLCDVISRRVDHLVLFGEAGPKVLRALQPFGYRARPYTIDLRPRLQEAVEVAARHAQPGDVVLLSPGGTSFDEFVDFEERGERFKAWVGAL